MHAVFVLPPTRGWFSGYFVQENNEILSVLGIEKEEEDCIACEENGFIIEITNPLIHKRVKRIARKHGGDYFSLTGDGISFSPTSLLCDAQAQSYIIKYFPDIVKRTKDSPEVLLSCLVCIGEYELGEINWEEEGVEERKVNEPILMPDQVRFHSHRNEKSCCVNEKEGGELDVKENLSNKWLSSTKMRERKITQEKKNEDSEIDNM